MKTVSRIDERCKIGSIFGALTVVGPVRREWRSGKNRPVVMVECKCSMRFDVLCFNLGSSSTCQKCQADAAAKHRDKASLLYGVWSAMRRRCYNRNIKDFKNYGARGIKVCEEWNDYLAFRTWAIANGYSPGLEIDRRDNDGNYCPENCRWVTHKENSRNKRTNTLLVAFGETKILTEWLEDQRCAVSRHGLMYRLKKGVNHEVAISLPSQRGKK